MPENLNPDEKAIYNLMIGNDPEKLYVSLDEIKSYFTDGPDSLGR